MKTIALRFTLSIFLATGSVFATTIVSDFITNADGWTASNNASVAWVNSGGNPGGFLQETDGGNGNMHVTAPSKFLFDYSNGNFILSVDLKAFATPASPVAAFGTLNFISASGTLINTTLVPSIPTSWSTYSLALNAANFGNNPNFATIMSSLTSVTLVLEADKNSNSEVVGMDNFIISDATQSDVATLPEPGTLTLMAGGIALALLSRRRRRN